MKNNTEITVDVKVVGIEEAETKITELNEATEAVIKKMSLLADALSKATKSIKIKTEIHD